MENFRALLGLHLYFPHKTLLLARFACLVLPKCVSGLETFGSAAFAGGFRGGDGEVGEDVGAEAAGFLEDALLLAVVPEDEAAGGELDADGPAGRSHSELLHQDQPDQPDSHLMLLQGVPRW